VKGALRKRSLTISGHATSLSLEPAFWQALEETAAARRISLAALVSEIDRERSGTLASAARLFVLATLKASAATR